MVKRASILASMNRDISIFYEFLKAHGLPIGTVRQRRGGKFIKVAPDKWKRYSAHEAAKKGRKVQEKKRGRKGKRAVSGVPLRTYTLFNKRSGRRPITRYAEKGKFGAYNASAGIPKGGKMLLVNADGDGRSVIGEAHTKKGAAKLMSIAGGKDTRAVAYVPNRGRKRAGQRQITSRLPKKRKAA